VEVGSYQSIVGRAPKGSVDGLYTAGISGTTGQLVFVPVINVYGSGPATAVTLNLPEGVVPSAIASSRNPDQSTDLFVIGGDTLYMFPSSDLDAKPSKATPIKLMQNAIFSGTDKLFGMAHQDTITLWGKNGGDQVFYLSCKQSDKSNGAKWSFPVPILEGMEEISPYLNLVDGGNTLFASGNGVLEKITQNTASESKLWSVTQISLPAPPQAPPVSFNSYTTTIQLNDANNLPVGNQAVSLSANQRTAVFINGLYYVLTANPIQVKSNASGMITIMEAKQP
jgi:hypothetical protein